MLLFERPHLGGVQKVEELLKKIEALEPDKY